MNETQKTKVEKILNNLSVDASVFYAADGTVCIKVAPWHQSNQPTEEPKTIRGRMVFKGKYHEGDGGTFVPYNQTEKTAFCSLLKTPHGELKTTEKRVQVQFSFWKTQGRESIMKELYKEVMEMKRITKPYADNVPWEKLGIKKSKLFFSTIK